MRIKTTTVDPSSDHHDFLNDLIDRKEAARLLRITPESLAVMHCRGKIPLSRYKRGRESLYSKSEIAEYIRSCRIPATA
jgi:hypothetical protein